MNIEALAFAALVCAALPCGLFLLNLFAYRSTPHSKLRPDTPVSVLIPARNEEANIVSTLQPILHERALDFEVIVLDDHSTDRTAEMVRALAREDARLRLETAPPLPPGWCGKQHACHVLAQLARHPILVFLDADVRLAPGALPRMAAFMEQNPAALASGVPHQELGTFSERLLLPLIHFVLLGFLPMHAMRWTRLPAMSGGCGQLFVARREAYHACGGHAAIRASLHDGVKLPRVFRQAGFATDLFDATDLATCRMYRTDGDTWRGLAKNATEGLAAPGTLLPMSIILLLGQVLPFLLLPFAFSMSALGWVVTITAAGLAWLPRLVAVWKFRHPLGSALGHPLGILGLLAIQWHAAVRRRQGRPSEWKGRQYQNSPSGLSSPRPA